MASRSSALSRAAFMRKCSNRPALMKAVSVIIPTSVPMENNLMNVLVFGWSDEAIRIFDFSDFDDDRGTSKTK